MSITAKLISTNFMHQNQFFNPLIPSKSNFYKRKQLENERNKEENVWNSKEPKKRMKRGFKCWNWNSTPQILLTHHKSKLVTYKLIERFTKLSKKKLRDSSEIGLGVESISFNDCFLIWAAVINWDIQFTWGYLFN